MLNFNPISDNAIMDEVINRNQSVPGLASFSLLESSSSYCIPVKAKSFAKKPFKLTGGESGIITA